MLVVRDNGVGMPHGFQIKDTKSLGIRIVTLLSQQIGRDVELRSDGGAEFRVYIPLKGAG